MAFYIDSDGTYYQELNATQLLREDGLILFKVDVTPLTPVTGNPIGLLLSLTYS